MIGTTQTTIFISCEKQIRLSMWTKLIKDTKIKVQAQIQGDSVRVTGKKKDELQTVMQELKSQNFDFDMQFTNYR